MEQRRILALFLVLLALCIGIMSPILAFTSLGTHLLGTMGLLTPTATPTPLPPTPTPLPKPILTVNSKPPIISATAGYLVDMDTGHILADINGEETLPMASTTKIMTALIAIQTGDLNQLVPVKQDALNRILAGGSSAQLVLDDEIPLKDLLYGLLLPSGDDAAVAIADALGGNSNNFVQRMNLFAYRLRLFHTHYSNPDGLTLDNNQNHYTTASDLIRLTAYAMAIPLFARIVQTQSYTLAANGQHRAYQWATTNLLLASYAGMVGIKTGHTDAAGYCLVFEAIRNGHHLMGVVLNSPSETQRNQDVISLLNWGFALPLLPPNP